ncbi:MAG: sugar ABC transporter permease [Lachnospiraceae bacterium]|nr:sugar ABC transporter permease [Lachnospiraceae bacterium]
MDNTTSVTENTITRKRTKLGRDKWGYIFLIPFFVVFLVFSFYPLLQTVYFSFFDHYTAQDLTEVHKFVWFKNYKALFSEDTGILRLGFNTMVLWIMGFVPQIIFSLLLASWFANTRLRIRAAGFFKAVIYLPNLIMAIAFGMMIFLMFSRGGPVHQVLESFGMAEDFDLFTKISTTRGLIAFINFIMWFGNTTILLMAGIMGINESLFEAAEVDGASQFQVFRKITLPVLRPILVYVLITSLIGGIQMYDVPQVITKGKGMPMSKDIFSSSGPAAETIIMRLATYISKSQNFGAAGALSVVLLIVTGILSYIVYRFMVKNDD